MVRHLQSGHCFWYNIKKVCQLIIVAVWEKNMREKETSESGQIRFTIEQDPYNFVMKVFCNRWKPFIIQAVRFDGYTRFNKFPKQLPISEKVLSANLKELEQDGLIVKTVYPEVPPRVEYRLTESGKSVSKILDTMYDWGWHEMKRRDMSIDPLGEMWHGYREKDETLMYEPYKKEHEH